MKGGLDENHRQQQRSVFSERYQLRVRRVGRSGWTRLLDLHSNPLGGGKARRHAVPRQITSYEGGPQ